jgi:CBS domain-containing protein
MNPAIPAVPSDEPVWRVWKTLSGAAIKEAPVHKDGQLVGIISIDDLRVASRLNGGNNTVVYELLFRDPISIGPDMDVISAVQILIEKEISAVTVVDQSGKILGVFGVGEALKALNLIGLNRTGRI